MSDRGLEQEYVSDDGDVLTMKQIGRVMRHEPSKVEKTEEGYIVAGTEYRPKS
ncbi:hypothetical protein [Saliphagus sp. LR7]|uniref:hypothetical protein n=1 Tax=Saliphagus sp. LR7 TaxID=2282654 RepID=UPI0013008AAB|nr:hypothetical protein [Saliphagus sp. LR7]